MIWFDLKYMNLKYLQDTNFGGSKVTRQIGLSYKFNKYSFGTADKNSQRYNFCMDP